MMDALSKLQLQHLPELRSLSAECDWLKCKFGLSDKKALISSETRLLQFAGIVDNLIEQIKTLTEHEATNSEYLAGLEVKISQTILPVREKLRERLREAKYYESNQDSEDETCVFYATDISKSTSQLTKIFLKTTSNDCLDRLKEFSLNSPTAFHAGSNDNVLKNKSKSFSKIYNRTESPKSSKTSLRKMSSCDFSEGYTTSSSCSSESSDSDTISGYPSKSGSFVADSKELGAFMKKSRTMIISEVENFMIGFSTACQPHDFTSLANHASLSNVTHDGAIPKENANNHVPLGFDSGANYPSQQFLGLCETPQVVPVSTVSASDTSNALEAVSVNSCDVSLQPDTNDASVSSVKDAKRKGDNCLTIDDNSTVDNAGGLLQCGGQSDGLSYCNDDDFRMSSRRRRKLSQIVPNPRKQRTADFNCSVCNEQYQKVCDENPWWAVYHHECPKCKSVQVPRLDISVSTNAIELDPNVVALYGEGIDDGDCDGFENYGLYEDDDDGLDGENCEYVEEMEEDDTKDAYPFDAEGMLTQDQAAKLLVLMSHARTCTGIHSSPTHADICRSTKFLMLHVRDCAGIDMNGKQCVFSWCSPVKKMLRHLTRCFEPDNCSVCNPAVLLSISSGNYCQLTNNNKVRAPAASFAKDKLIYTSKLESRDALAFKLELRKDSPPESLSVTSSIVSENEINMRVSSCCDTTTNEMNENNNTNNSDNMETFKNYNNSQLCN